MNNEPETHWTSASVNFNKQTFQIQAAFALGQYSWAQTTWTLLWVFASSREKLPPPLGIESAEKLKADLSSSHSQFGSEFVNKGPGLHETPHPLQKGFWKDSEPFLNS